MQSDFQTLISKTISPSGVSPSVKKNLRVNESTVNIMTVNTNKDLTGTQSLLEFFLVSLSKHFSLTPKQSVALLSNNFKYLAHLLAKGLKGVFEPIVYWYKDIYANSSHLVNLVLKDKEQNLNLIQQGCKAGLLSKN